MYILFGIFIALCVLFFIIGFWHRKSVMLKVCRMDFCEKLCLLNKLADQFGFSYIPVQDIMTSEIDAWQRDFGYCYLYDESAPRFNMVFDCEPVYFDYDGRTWLIEFWKGQYGVTTGGEVGIYYADTIVPPEKYRSTLFHAVSDDDMLFISMSMFYKKSPLFFVCRSHWWLTGFRVGMFCKPGELEADVSIAFPCENMMTRFIDALTDIGYEERELYLNGLTVSFAFCSPHTDRPGLSRRFWSAVSQFENRVFCKLYNMITRPFIRSIDKILYLYFFLPIAFRRLLLFKRNRRQKFNRREQRTI